MGDAPPSEKSEDDNSTTVLFLDRTGTLLEQRKLKPLSSLDGMDDDSIWGYPHTRTWRALNAEKTRWAMENFHGVSDGAHYSTFIVDIALRRYHALGEFSLVAVESGGKHLLLAKHKWIGPYKRGGRRCGALEIISLLSGKRKALTTKLVSIEGGDWRRTSQSR
jgi:hypothetical protein